jgi:hypothetical protein
MNHNTPTLAYTIHILGLLAQQPYSLLYNSALSKINTVECLVLPSFDLEWPFQEHGNAQCKALTTHYVQHLGVVANKLKTMEIHVNPQVGQGI